MEQKEFIHDKFYEKGNIGLKVQQLLAIIALWLIMLFPVVVVINSLGEEPIWPFIYHFNYAEGLTFFHFILITVMIGLVVMVIFSVVFLTRNNHYEQKIFFEKKMYDEERMDKRTAVLEEIYEERFGSREYREGLNYFVVSPEQNFPDNYIEETFKERGNI